jgi:signal peptidase I
MKRVVGRALLLLLALALALGFVRTSIAGVFRVAGPSDAPTILLRQVVLVNLAAYDLRLPGLARPVARWNEPRRGEMVLFRVPQRESIGFKRVVAVPGDRVETAGHRLIVNGVEATYEPLLRSAFDSVPAENQLGDHVAVERVAGFAHAVSWRSAGGPVPDAGPVVVPEGHVFVLGDNRDMSFDSRSFGPLARERVRGRLVFREIPAARR